jgi:MPBQ/MSBQ methyltransferase
MFAQPITFENPIEYPQVIRPHPADIGIKADYIYTMPQTIQEMYGRSNLAEFPMFAGGYINFGFWKGIDIKEGISQAARIHSSENLYDYLFAKAHFDRNSEILEVGSGLGVGCKLISTKYPSIRNLVGLDNNLAQIERSKRYNPNLLFVHANAEKLPFGDNSFTHVISLESAQHFQSMPHFLLEALRVLKPGGKFVCATFFPSNEVSVNKLRYIIPDFNIHLTKFTALDIFKEFLTQNFCLFTVESIGEFVWPGLDAWLAQNQILKHQWSRLWFAAYQNKLLDYYVIQAEKLSVEAQLKLKLCAKL